MTSMSKTISIEAAMVASLALGSAIKQRKDRIAVLKNSGKELDPIVEAMEKFLQEDMDAFKEVAGYEWFD